jgi:hypothetical protein
MTSLKIEQLPNVGQQAAPGNGRAVSQFMRVEIRNEDRRGPKLLGEALRRDVTGSRLQTTDRPSHTVKRLPSKALAALPRHLCN